MRRAALLVAVLAAAAGAIVFTRDSATPVRHWSASELSLLQSLSLSSVKNPPADPSNRFAQRRDAAKLGRALFFDKHLSANGRVSCAACHMPSRDFQDGRKLAHGIGTTTRRTMSLVGAAWQTWFFWDGRKDSLWSQALGPLENPLEHGLTRAEIVRIIGQRYGPEYEAVFGPVWSVNRAFANVGKAIAAYETRIRLEPARFDRYVAAAAAGNEDGMRDAMSAEEEEGLALFVGKAGCGDCHSGPFFTNGEFHNTGVPPNPAVGVDEGRFAGLAKLRADEFNCLGEFSDAKPNVCAMQFLPRRRAAQRGAFKPPGLRNVTRTAPYMHGGQFASLAEVLGHYNRAPRAVVGRSELHPLGLADRQLRMIEAFLATLESRVRAP